MKKVYKSTIIIYSEFDPLAYRMDIDELSKNAVNGNSYCTEYNIEKVDRPDLEFFEDGEENEFS